MPLKSLENELRLLARSRIAEGRLPSTVPARAWAGRGSDAPCSLCDKIIASGEVEYEVESRAGESTRIHRFHFLCHAAWQLECARHEHLSGAGRKR